MCLRIFVITYVWKHCVIVGTIHVFSKLRMVENGSEETFFFHISSSSRCFSSWTLNHFIHKNYVTIIQESLSQIVNPCTFSYTFIMSFSILSTTFKVFVRPCGMVAPFFSELCLVVYSNELTHDFGIYFILLHMSPTKTNLERCCSRRGQV